jgi:hypothetical protein
MLKCTSANAEKRMSRHHFSNIFTMQKFILSAMLTVSLFAFSQTTSAQVQVQAPAAQVQQQSTNLSKAEALKIAEQANDPKLIELIKKSSDSSFKTATENAPSQVPAVGAQSSGVSRYYYYCQYRYIYIHGCWYRILVCR